MQVIYYDNHLIVVSKPAGMATQPALHLKTSLEEELTIWARDAFRKPGNVFLHAVHRLDRVVSGLVLFAKTSKALSRLQQAMRAQECGKSYIAWVEGEMEVSTGELCHYLVRQEHRTQVVSQKTPEAKEARLSFQVLERRRGASCVQIDLKTGRYHQIRAQFAKIGHPIIGDHKYGSQVRWEDQILLHHKELIFTHPTTQEKKVFIQEPPAIWEEKLRSAPIC